MENVDRKDLAAVENDLINSPNHYKGIYGLENREVLKNFVPKYNKYGGMVSSDMKDVIKYVIRAPEKGGLEDLKKAQKFLGWVIEDLEREKVKSEITPSGESLRVKKQNGDFLN